MKRKLIKQGGGGYTIYLPKKWVEGKKFKAGDEIDLSEVDSSLVIGSHIQGKEEITIKITKENEGDIKNILTHLYRKGFSKITIEGVDNALGKEIRAVTKELLLGFELTEKTDRKCVIENISEPTGEKYELLLRRVFFIIQEIIGEITNDFESGKFDGKSEIEDMKKQEDKLILFCRRLLIKEKYDKEKELSWELLTFLMHISHALHYFYSYAESNKIKKNPDLVRLLKYLKEYFNLFYDSYYHKNISSVHKINTLKNKYQFGEIIKLLETSKGKETVLYSYMREIFRLIQTGTSPVLSSIIGKEIHSD